MKPGRCLLIIEFLYTGNKLGCRLGQHSSQSHKDESENLTRIIEASESKTIDTTVVGEERGNIIVRV